MSTTDPPPVQPLPSQPSTHVSLPLHVFIAALLLILFFIGFFSLFFCKCIMPNLINSLYNRPSPNSTPVNPPPTNENAGLDPLLIKSFPTLQYSSVKDLRLREENYGLECAICLCEFEDDDLLKLLTDCCHVFHQGCVDLWLESHKSCPVCRRNLDPNEKYSPEKTPPPPPPGISNLDTRQRLGDDHERRSSVDSYTINVNVKGGDDHRASSLRGVGCSAQGNIIEEFEKFSRSHSTGHSIVECSGSEANISPTDGTIKDDYKRYTLRLPEYVKQSIKRRHMQTLSCTAFGELSSSNRGIRRCLDAEVSAAGCSKEIIMSIN